jgi:hypothetical protein
MNFWKPIALVSMASMIVTVGYQSAQASPAPKPEPTVTGGQPHMVAALKALETAKSELQKAEHDKGGWRSAAAIAAETAIKEVNRGIAFDAPR